MDRHDRDVTKQIGINILIDVICLIEERASPIWAVTWLLESSVSIGVAIHFAPPYQ